MLFLTQKRLANKTELFMYLFDNVSNAKSRIVFEWVLKYYRFSIHP